MRSFFVLEDYLLRRKLAFQSVVSVSVRSASETTNPAAQQDPRFCVREGLPAGRGGGIGRIKVSILVQFIAFVGGG